MIRISFFTYLLFLSPHLYGMRPCAVSIALSRIQAHKGEVLSKINYPCSSAQFPWLPKHFIVKENHQSRHEGGEILRRCKDAQALDLVIVPRYWPFMVTLLNSKLSYCLADYIEGTHQGELNAAHMRQIITLLKTAQRVYGDIKPENLLFTPDGKIAFPDTEMSGFLPQGASPLEALKRVWEKIARNDEAHRILVAEIMQLQGSLKRKREDQDNFLSEERLKRWRPAEYDPTKSKVCDSSW